MGIPYSKINVGDIFESPMKWTGSNTVYMVVNKCDGLIELCSSFSHPQLSKTIWKPPTDRIFTKKIL